MKGSHCLKHWSKTQQNITLSSAESELVALVKGSCEGIGMASLMEDLNGKSPGVVDMYTDATAAIGITQREGVGRTRHIDVGMLWIQQRQKMGKIGIHKVDTRWNPADVLTKHVPAEVMGRHLDSAGLSMREGRAEAAVELVAQ